MGQQTQEFKDKYIQSIFDLAPPFLGAPKLTKLLLSGDNEFVESIYVTDVGINWYS